MKSAIPFGLGALALAVSSSLYAQTDDTMDATLDPIVVTATMTPQKQSEALSNVTVISREDIAAAQGMSLAELLKQKAGVEFVTQGGMGQLTSVFIRGANSTHTLVLIDGVRIASPIQGVASIEHLPLDNVDHIEVLKSPGSALYGADAIGGVIQIFTNKKPERWVTAGVGSYDASKIAAGLADKTDQWSYGIEAGYEHQRGFNATTPQNTYNYNPDKDGYTNQHGSFRLAYAPTVDSEIGITASYLDAKVNYDAGLYTNDFSTEQLGVYTAYAQGMLTDNWHSRLSVAQTQDKLIAYGAYPGHSTADQQETQWSNRIALSTADTILFGAEYLDQRISSSTTYTQTSRNVSSAYAGYMTQRGAHQLQVNARHDDNSQFGSANTGNLHYGYAVNSSVTLLAGWGTAFKAPTFADLYYPNVGYYVGNPNLQPERSREQEYGIKLTTQQHKLTAQYFKNVIDNMIVYDPNQPIPTVSNLAKGEIEGVELSYSGTVAGYLLAGNWVNQQAKDVATGNYLPRRAQQHGSFSVFRPWGAWNLGAEVTGSGRRYDSVYNSSTNAMGGFALLNLVAEYHFDKKTTARLRLNNVLDKQYELAKGYATPGANWFLSVNHTF